jgi:hypothetical protein
MELSALTSERLAGPGARLHLTLAHTHDVIEYDAAVRLAEDLRGYASRYHPFSTVEDSYESWETPKGRIVVMLLKHHDALAIHALNAAELLARHGFTPSMEHTWKAHITVGNRARGGEPAPIHLDNIILIGAKLIQRYVFPLRRKS